MSAYYAFIDDKVLGPYPFEALEKMQGTGRIKNTTYVKRETDAEWSTWNNVLESVRSAPPALPPTLPKVQAIGLPVVSSVRTLRDLRRLSHYPNLRTGCTIWMATNVLAAFILGCYAVDQQQPLFIIAAVISLSGIIPPLLAIAILDGVDGILTSVTKKEE